MTVPTGVPGFLHHVSSKSAIVGLTRALARELGEHGIAVNTISPCYIPHD
jgi:3-oxoacyl-[acyl-carrier protein] reductase